MQDAHCVKEMQSVHPVREHWRQEGPATGKKSLATSQVVQVVRLPHCEQPGMLQD